MRPTPLPDLTVSLSLIWPMRVCAAEQGMVFKVSFWTGSLSKSVNTCDERSTFAIPIIFFLTIYFHDFSVKNKYVILYAKQRKSGSESSVLCLKQSSEMRNLCLKRGRGWQASAALLHPDFP